MAMAWEGLTHMAVCSCQAGYSAPMLLCGMLLSVGSKGDSWLSQDAA